MALRIRAVEGRWRQQLIIWWIPIAQLLITAAIAACLVMFLDKYQALADGDDYFWDIRKRESSRLRISEVTTLVSASMVIVRILVSCWTAVLVSSCVFILLEDPGLKISALDNVMIFGLPWFWPKGRKGWTVATVLLLLFPQQFTSPLVTGAVGWSAVIAHSEELKNITSISRVNNVTIARGMTNITICDSPRGRFASIRKRQSRHGTSAQIQHSCPPCPDLDSKPTNCRDVSRLEFGGVTDDDWIEFRDWTVFLGTVVNTQLAPRQAAGLSTALWPPNGRDEKVGRRSCRTRVAANQPQVPVNSTADNVDLPCILVNNISWTSPTQGVKNITTERNSTSETHGQIRLTEYPTPGAAMLVNGTYTSGTNESIDEPIQSGYSPGQVIRHPNESMFSGTLGLLIQLYAFREDVPMNETLNCNQHSLDNQTIFGSLQQVPNTAIFKGESGCYAYAVVNLTAGMVNFKKANFVHPDALEGISDSPLTPADFKPDIWVLSSLRLSRNVMVELSTSNSTKIPTWNNLDGYTETLIRQSYLGSWGVLRSLQSNSTTLEVHLAEPRLQASVSWGRVLSWFLISLFVPVSALVWYFGAQSTSKRNLVLNHTIAALLTDVSKVLDDPQAKGLDLTNLSYVTKEDKGLRLFLVKDKDVGKHSLSLLPPLKKKRGGKKSERAGLMEYKEF